MNQALTTFSHDEISLLLFSLQGGSAAPVPDAESCEEACPVVESVEELPCGGKLGPKQQLVRHLNNHIREALIESGLFELMATGQASSVDPGATPSGSAKPASPEDQIKLRQVTAELGRWTCQIKLDPDERRLLSESFSRLPRSSWITMPRTMWRLRKKLKAT